jgi:outer membrane protein assembly factor BamC
MLKRLMVSLGVQQQQAASMLAASGTEAPKAALTKGSAGTVISLDEDFSRAWRRVGLALDRVGFTVVDRDRSRGLYYVRYIAPSADEQKGILSKLAFWRADADPDQREQYLVKLEDEGAATRVGVQDQDGNPDQSKTAQQILTLLYEQLK